MQSLAWPRRCRTAFLPSDLEFQVVGNESWHMKFSSFFFVVVEPRSVGQSLGNTL